MGRAERGRRPGENLARPLRDRAAQGRRGAPHGDAQRARARLGDAFRHHQGLAAGPLVAEELPRDRQGRAEVSAPASRMAAMDTAKFKPNTVYVTYIAATPEKVWQALTDPAFTRQYFSGLAVDVEPRAGGSFFLRYPDGRVHISGRVIEWSPPQRFSC